MRQLIQTSMARKRTSGSGRGSEARVGVSPGLLISLATMAMVGAVSAAPAHGSTRLAFTSSQPDEYYSNYSVFESGGSIYVGTGTGVSVSNDNGASWTNLPRNTNGLPNSLVTSIYVSGGKVFAATSGGVSISGDIGADGTPTGSWTTYTRNNTNGGLASNSNRDIHVNGLNIYTAMNNNPGGGVGVSTDGGLTWETLSGNGLGGTSGTSVAAVYESNGVIYAGTSAGGVSVTSDGGEEWTTFDTDDGLSSNAIFCVFESGGVIYAGTDHDGLNISADGGDSWDTYNTTNGLVGDSVTGVYVIGGFIYVATTKGLSIGRSEDGGVSWENYTEADGLADDILQGVYVSDGTVYTVGWGGVSIAVGASAVPGAGVAGLATLGLAGLARRRRR
jgi:hypothetical protein